MAREIESLLVSLGIIDPASIEKLHPRVRDREDVAVFRCRKSGVIFLKDSGPAAADRYQDHGDFRYWSAESRRLALAETFDDDHRRAQDFGPLLRGKNWLDFGTGAGGILDLLAPQVASCSAVEIQQGPREELKRLGYAVFPEMAMIPDASLDVVTAFHVLEHLLDPLAILKEMRQKLRGPGRVVIEVPHARDSLLALFDCSAFKDFTFWSEHLILHTRQSLEILLAAAGFREITIRGFQRYPVANHLHWLSRGRPGGHVAWNHLRSDALDKAYADTLASLDITDTLIASARKE